MTKAKAPRPAGGEGDYVVLGGKKLQIRRHDTDFTVLAGAKEVRETHACEAAAVSPRLTRASAKDAEARDGLMEKVRENAVAHHVYLVGDGDEELTIDDRIILNLKREGTGELQAILDEYHLKYDRKMGNAHVLRLTSQTNMNPVKAANRIAKREEVEACCPHVLMDLQWQSNGSLFHRQWYLTTDLLTHPHVLPNADIRAPEAWELTSGDPEIVVAVMDDGFDLGHPALGGVAIHPGEKDFAQGDVNPAPSSEDYHGTPVASIAIGAHHADGMRGIAPECTFLPIRLAIGPTGQDEMLDIFNYVSERADVVNCSFGFPPTSYDLIHPSFRQELTQLAATGGRRGKGLVIVFAAGNDDAPTFLDGAANNNGVKYTRRTWFGTVIAEIPAGTTVFSGYPMTEGVVVVGAMSSLTRKSGYSSWGPHVTVVAPSNNMHYIKAFITPGSDPRRDEFIANYRGLGQVAAANRPGHGDPYSPLPDDPSTPLVQENHYTEQFGGTSGAAPVVTGVVALMLSVNPDLTAADIRQILMATADRDLDSTLDLANDPNVQGLSGEFVNGRSLFFGSGKVNAFHAVRRARALNPTEPPLPDGPIEFSDERRPNLLIPDNRREGVVSHIDCGLQGRLADISVDVDI
ncbi:MAG: S8 family serine peptidase, partial [Phycisphaerae bacterium]